MFLQHPSASLSRALCHPFPEQCGRHAEALSVNRIGLDKKIVPLVNRAAAGEQKNLSVCPLRKTFYVRR